MKHCSKCKIKKPLTEFYKDNSHKTGYTQHCKQCSGDYSRKRRLANKDHFKNTKLLYDFGITLNQYRDFLKAQKYTCAICPEPIGEARRNTVVDHDHETGKVRGILCRHCNLGLGHFRDSRGYLKRAIEYLNANSPN